jgi:bacteriocin-like protein
MTPPEKRENEMANFNELTLDDLAHVSGGDVSFQLFGYQVDIFGGHDGVTSGGRPVHFDGGVMVTKLPSPKNPA